jgi:type IV secretory pathway TrbF-like protein
VAVVRRIWRRPRAITTASVDGKKHHEILYEAMKRSVYGWKLCTLVLLLVWGWDRIERWPLISAKQYAPVILHERPDGSMTYVGQPDPSWRPHDGNVIEELFWAIQTLRGRTKDARFDDKLWNRLWQRCTDQGHALMAEAFEEVEKRDKTQDKGPIRIDKMSVNKLSEHTFDVRWEETRKTPAEGPLGPPTRWRGVFTVVIDVPTTLAGWQQNPKGVLLDSWSITEDKV